MNDLAERFETMCYSLNGIVYLPHYRNREIFIGPGYPFDNKDRYSGEELKMMGAKQIIEFLWSRGSSGEVSNKYP